MFKGKKRLVNVNCTTNEGDEKDFIKSYSTKYFIKANVINSCIKLPNE